MNDTLEEIIKQLVERFGEEIKNENGIDHFYIWLKNDASFYMNCVAKVEIADDRKSFNLKILND